MIKVALFDFCETLANFQTADEFVHFVRNLTSNKAMLRRQKIYNILKATQFIRVFNRLFSRSSLNKRCILYQLKGFSKTDLDKYASLYYQNVIKPNLIQEVVNELLGKQETGYKIVIVSGGYDIYLNCFAQEYKISDVISTKLKFKNEQCLGMFDGKDCLWENKIDMLNNYFSEIIINKENSYAYSDSITDIPLLEYVKNGVVVRNIKKSWWGIDKYREIIWGK